MPLQPAKSGDSSHRMSSPVRAPTHANDDEDEDIQFNNKLKSLHKHTVSLQTIHLKQRYNTQTSQAPNTGTNLDFCRIGGGPVLHKQNSFKGESAAGEFVDRRALQQDLLIKDKNSPVIMQLATFKSIMNGDSSNKPILKLSSLRAVPRNPNKLVKSPSLQPQKVPNIKRVSFSKNLMVCTYFTDKGLRKDSPH